MSGAVGRRHGAEQYAGSTVYKSHCLWYLSQLAADLGLNFDSLAENNLKKLARRYGQVGAKNDKSVGNDLSEPGRNT